MSNAALTADGRLYTWGTFNRGALGLGNPDDIPIGAPGGYRTQEDLDAGNWLSIPEVEVPTQVRSDHGEAGAARRVCIGVGVGIYHAGALVIDIPSKVRPSDSQ